MKHCDAFASNAKHIIVIQKFTKTDDDFGGQTVVWSDLLTVWSMIEPMSGKEVFEHQQLQSQVTHKFTIRFQSTLTDTQIVGKHRISHDNRLFDIKHIRNIDELDEFMEIFAEEGSGI